MISNFLKSLNNGTLLLSIYRNLNHRKYTVQESNNLIGLYMRLVCYEKVHDKYMYVLENHKPSKKIDQVKSNYLWVSWFQGYDNAPELPRKCIDNIRSRFSDYQVVLIDQDNFSEYIDIPDWFLEKWKKGMIDNTKLSNLIRLELLIKYGGIWMDSTVFCSDSKLPDYITNSDLFMYAENGLGDIRMGATWLISAKSNNNILRATRDVYLEYWKNENELIEYFLITFCIKMAAEKYPEEWRAMPKIPAINQYMLATDVFGVYDEFRWNQLKNLTSIHKLSFKESKDLYEIPGTYYEKLIRNMESYKRYEKQR